jgi:hypothetical protein
MDENLCHGNAWRYRDYVIAAFNGDKPYGDFVCEQLAGDLLSAPGDGMLSRERLIATGFLSLGPKVLAEVDEIKMEMDIVDEQIEAVGRAFMALTLGCARCHDHKFDPITTTDYYGLAGIFKSTRTMEHFKKIARWWENSLASEDERAAAARHAARIELVKERIRLAVDEANASLSAAGGPDFKLPQDPESSYPADVKARLDDLRRELSALEMSAPELPTAMGVTEGTVTDVEVHIRGSHLSLGPRVPRRFPHVLAGDQQAPFGAGQSGRRQLAEWLTSGTHPLTNRVIVNRVWRWHFGRGIVRSTDNFGIMGDWPTHSLLLDHLAVRLAAYGGSLKRLHHWIMRSNTYGMSSRFDADAAAVDPENRRRWRADIVRLDVESIRDAMLAVSEELDRTVSGSMLPVKNREFLFDHTSKDSTQYDSSRRSIYLPVIRNHLYDMFQLFDYPDPTLPTGDRGTTTTAPQALFLLNSRLADRLSLRLARNLLAAAVPGGDRARIELLYETAYARTATRREVEQALEFLRRFETAMTDSENEAVERRSRAWQALCQVTLCSNEFVYIR